MNKNSTVTVFAVLNFLFSGLALSGFLIVSAALIHAIVFLGDPKEIAAAGIFGSLPPNFLIGFVLFLITGIGLLKRKTWGYYLHIIASMLAAISFIGIIYTIFGLVFAFKPEFKAEFFTLQSEQQQNVTFVLKKKFVIILLLLGSLLTLFGLIALTEFTFRLFMGVREFNFMALMISIPSLIIGILMIKATKTPYHGGWPFVIGILLVDFGLTAAASELDAIFFHTRPSGDPISMGSSAVICLVVGILLIRSGHRRHLNYVRSNDIETIEAASEIQKTTTTEDQQKTLKKSSSEPIGISIMKILLILCSTIQIMIGFSFITAIIRFTDTDKFVSSGLILFLLMFISGIIGIIISIKQKKVSLFISINAIMLFYLVFETISPLLINSEHYPNTSGFQDSPVTYSLVSLISLFNIVSAFRLSKSREGFRFNRYQDNKS